MLLTYLEEYSWIGFLSRLTQHHAENLHTSAKLTEFEADTEEETELQLKTRKKEMTDP
jgi:hypothetical protein